MKAEKDLEREKSILRRMQTCKHFTGIQHETCKAGMSYDEERYDEGRAPGTSPFPCLNPDLDTCPRRDYMTREEAEAQEDETERIIAEFMTNVSIVRPKIVEHIGHRKKQFVQDRIPCPICNDGTITYAYYGQYNRHIHCHCSTEGCVQWME